MVSVWRGGQWVETARFVAFLCFLAMTFLWGGASRLDVTSLLFLQPFAVLFLGIFLLLPGPMRWASVKTPLFLLGALGAIILAQLIPLPPAIWAGLPGHAPFAEAVAASGTELAWRPISLTPDLTLASLVGLITPLTALVGFAALNLRQSQQLLVVLIAGVGLSALLGLAQIAGGSGSAFYLYQITNDDSPVGFFANRNHNVVLLAAALPLLAIWIRSRRGDSRRRLGRLLIAAALALLIVLLLLVTGSRAGLGLGLAGIATAWAMLRYGAPEAVLARLGRWRWLADVLPLLVVAVTIAVATLLSRNMAFERLQDTSFTGEQRAQTLPTLLQIARDFFPTGSGFGSFDPVFRSYEPAALLRTTYLNHAHNDVLELVITGGLPAVLVVLLFLAWFMARLRHCLNLRDGSTSGDLARAGALMIAFLLLASIVDYPLRTPLAGMLMAIACGWLGDAGTRPRGTAEARRNDGQRPLPVSAL